MIAWRPVDDVTWRLAEEALIVAKNNGWNPIEILDRRYLLLTPARERQIVINALENLQEDLERWQPHEMIRRVRRDGNGTPADMYRAICGYLKEYIDEQMRNV